MEGRVSEPSSRRERTRRARWVRRRDSESAEGDGIPNYMDIVLSLSLGGSSGDIHQSDETLSIELRTAKAVGFRLVFSIRLQTARQRPLILCDQTSV